MMHATSVGRFSWNESAKKRQMPRPVPMKLAIAVGRTPKRSARNPLDITLATDSIPIAPKAVAAAIGATPRSMR